MKSASHQTFIIQANTIERRFFQKIVSIHFHLNEIPIQKILNATLQFPWGHIFTLKNMKPKKTI